MNRLLTLRRVTSMVHQERTIGKGLRLPETVEKHGTPGSERFVLHLRTDQSGRNIGSQVQLRDSIHSIIHDSAGPSSDAGLICRHDRTANVWHQQQVKHSQKIEMAANFLQLLHSTAPLYSKKQELL